MQKLRHRKFVNVKYTGPVGGFPEAVCPVVAFDLGLKHASRPSVGFSIETWFLLLSSVGTMLVKWCDRG